MAEKLSITIFLDGAAEIERQLEGIGQAGTKAFDAIGTAAEKAGGFDKLDPKDVTAKLEQLGVKGKAAIDKITAAVAQAGRLERVVGGVRAVEAGFASIGTAASAMSQRVTGAFTAIATAAAGTGGAIGRVGRSLGLLGSGALIGSLGAAALAMEKSADSARILEGNLQALFRSQSGGTAFFNQIQQAAQNAGSSLERTAQTMTAIVKELQKAFAAKGFRFAPGEGLKQSADIAAQAFDTLQKGMQLSGARADDAAKAIKALFAEISKNQPTAGDTFEQASQKAKAMADVLRKLAAEFPQLANALVKFLGTPGQTMDQLADQVEKGIRKIDIPKFLNALTRAIPEIEKLREAFDPTLAQRMDTISGAWDRLLNSFGKSPTGVAIKALLDDIAKGLDEIAKDRKQPQTLTGEFLNEVRKTIETTKREWEALVQLFNQTQINLGKKPPEKITVPFEADPEPAWVQAYLGFIERIKIAFANLVTKPVANAWTWLVTTLNAAIAGFPAALQKGAAIISTLVTTAVGGAWQWIVDTFNSAVAQLQAAGQAVLAGITRFVVTPVANAWQWIVDTFNAAVAGLTAAGQAVLTAITTFVTTPIAAAWQWIVTTFNTVIAQLSGAAQTAVAAVTTFVTTAASGAWQWIITTLNSVIGQIPGLAQSALAAITSLVTTPVANAWQWIIDTFRNVIAQLGFGGGAAGGQVGGRAAGGLIDGFQGGGLLGGRGTGTSDSNLVRVSRGEYIVPARAVRQPGVLAFLEALRHSGGRLQDIIDDMGRFALGGLVPRTIPAFATGGLAGGGMSNVTIQFPGLPEISGLRASEKVIDELRKTAALAQVRSGGRKPSRYT